MACGLSTARTCIKEKMQLPARFWGLDPLYWSNVKMFVCDVLRLEETEFKGTYCLYNHPVARVEITGIVVGVQTRQRLVEYTVDDGTGTISCCDWSKNGDDNDDKVLACELGDLVTVQGKITVFREQRQITASQIYLETDLNMEIFHWSEVINLHQTVYRKQFILPPDVSRDIGVSNISSLSTEDLQKQLMEVIITYVQRTGSFQFNLTSLTDQETVKEIAHVLLTRTSTKGYEAEMTIKVVKQAVKGLEKKGLCYCAEGDSYQVISHEANLGQEIIQIIQRETSNVFQKEKGVSIKKIQELLHRTLRYSLVSRKQIEISLEKLLRESKVYQQEEHSYCLV